MKRIISIAAAASLLSGTPALAQITPGQLRVVQPVAMQPAGTRALRCRGGPMQFVFFEQANASISEASVKFTKGTRPGDQGLEPGQCSWSDAAMSASDPDNLCQRVQHVNISMVYNRDSRYNPPDLWILQSAWSRDAKWLEGIRSETNTFGFFVANDGNNCLAIKGQF